MALGRYPEQKGRSSLWVSGRKRETSFKTGADAGRTDLGLGR